MRTIDGPIHIRLHGDKTLAQQYIPLAKTLLGITKHINGRMPNEPLDLNSIVQGIFGDQANTLAINGRRYNTNRGWDKNQYQMGGPLWATPDHKHTWRFIDENNNQVTVECNASLDIDRVKITTIPVVVTKETSEEIPEIVIPTVEIPEVEVPEQGGGGPPDKWIVCTVTHIERTYGVYLWDYRATGPRPIFGCVQPYLCCQNWMDRWTHIQEQKEIDFYIDNGGHHPYTDQFGRGAAWHGYCLRIVIGTTEDCRQQYIPFYDRIAAHTNLCGEGLPCTGMRPSTSASYLAGTCPPSTAGTPASIINPYSPTWTCGAAIEGTRLDTGGYGIPPVYTKDIFYCTPTAEDLALISCSEDYEKWLAWQPGDLLPS